MCPCFPHIRGTYLCWLDTNIGKFHGYEELVSALKSDFELPGFDDRLLQEIQTRTQAKHESLVVFLSIILGMMSRLSTELSDGEKLKIVMKNIRPDYNRELLLVDVKSIDHLRELGKRIEAGKLRMEGFSEPCFTKPSVVPDFIYKPKAKPDNSENKNTNYSNKKFPIASVQSSSPKKSSSYCFICKNNEHPTFRCKASRPVLCFKCGKPNVKSTDCPDCKRPKN